MYVVTSQDEVSVSWYLVQQEPGEEAAEHGAEGAHHEEEADLAQRHPHLQYSAVQHSTVQSSPPGPSGPAGSVLSHPPSGPALEHNRSLIFCFLHKNHESIFAVRLKSPIVSDLM